MASLRRRQSLVLYADNLDELIDEYLNESNFADKTRTNYRLAIAPFREYWRTFAPAENYKLARQTLIDFDRWHAEEYRRESGKRQSAFMLSRTGRVLAQFLNWLHAESVTDTNLSSWVVRRTYEPEPQFWPTAEDMNRLFKSLNGSDRLRDAAVFALAASTGARRFELAAITVGQVRFDTPITALAADGLHAGFVDLAKTKNGRPRRVAFCSTAGLLLKMHIRASNVKGSLFGLTDNGIALMVRRRCAAVGLPELTSHGFRRAMVEAWATVHSNDELGMLALRLQMGHSISKDVLSGHYLNLRNPQAVTARLKQFHVSPLTSIDFDWDKYPCHVSAGVGYVAHIEARPFAESLAFDRYMAELLGGRNLDTVSDNEIEQFMTQAEAESRLIDAEQQAALLAEWEANR